MEKLILVSHGTLCEGMKNSIEMILGPQDQIYTVSLLTEEGPEDFERQLKVHIEPDDDVTIFADLLGGTPANVISKQLMTGATYEVYAGMNLPMIVSYINGQMLGEQPDYVAKAQEGVVHINALLSSTDEDDE